MFVNTADRWLISATGIKLLN